MKVLERIPMLILERTDLTDWNMYLCLEEIMIDKFKFYINSLVLKSDKVIFIDSDNKEKVLKERYVK